ncbi:hypothetical protein CIRMBP1248_02523 [Enterococcus cecorum]|uniref:hypothetical protein n=1 Tax=Enterococcus cecorum TaxID=44008 RepID=UPI000E06484A|nr:hypothetical protein [Enterococcus cecorum]MCJ0538485.1 hypothetical protein [Enterococcus cecorum]MCJ0546732.1 hypothetical protein [Enterococcus cecorum]MCJ0551533.1 hypothetical protein [Enterococcus cecorum]MCJ0570164.1 hypothetical protein [Enterococcus cecorum]MCJ0593417.1 hypothetical protein [Enterococcus cecorum]
MKKINFIELVDLINQGVKSGTRLIYNNILYVFDGSLFVRSGGSKEFLDVDIFDVEGLGKEFINRKCFELIDELEGENSNEIR